MYFTSVELGQEGGEYGRAGKDEGDTQRHALFPSLRSWYAWRHSSDTATPEDCE